MQLLKESKFGRGQLPHNLISFKYEGNCDIFNGSCTKDCYYQITIKIRS